jgi:NAD(P)-dependent dehydrogenase (short-subunit alcohol dehydrogenase family)
MRASDGTAKKAAPTRGAVVVTGASTGIGEACAQRLARMGYRVFAGVRRDVDGERLERLVDRGIKAIRLDVTEESSIGEAARVIAEEVGECGLRGLVNNAGIAIAGPLEFLPIDDLRRQLEVNVTGQIAATQAFLPLLRQGAGRIVNMGSISGRLATPFLGPYAASKFALEALTDSLRMELQPWGVHVAIVEPGSIATPIWEKGIRAAEALEAELPEEALRLYGDAIRAVKGTAMELGAGGLPPSAVARAVAHALTAKRPKTRYIVGRDARIEAVVAKMVPDRLRDRLVTRLMRVPGRGTGTQD